MSVNSKMTAIADEIRELSGTTGTMGLDAMATHIGEANTEIDSQVELLATTVATLESKAQEPVLQDKTIAPSTSSQTIIADSGYDGLSKVTVNAMPITTQAIPSIIVDSDGKITASVTQTAGYVSAGTKSATKQLTTQAAKTVIPSTSSQTAVASGVYTTGAVTVGAIPSTYVKPTATKAATTYTPTTSNQTISAGTYCSGTQTIAGDANLIADNIKSGVSIFGVSGILEDSSGDIGVGDTLIAKTISGVYENSRVTTVGDYAFYSCVNITKVSFPNASTIGQSAFCNCTSLTSESFPNVEVISACAFENCIKLTTVNFPNVKIVDGYAFWYCSNLTTVSFPMATAISGWSCFDKCCNLKSLYLMGSSVCALSNSNAFTSTPIGGYSTSAGTYGSIYVPTSLLTSYKTATNWTYFSSRFVGI